MNKGYKVGLLLNFFDTLHLMWLNILIVFANHLEGVFLKFGSRDDYKGDILFF